MERLKDYRIRLAIVGCVTTVVLGGKWAKADFTFGEAVNLKSIIPVIDPAHESISCFSYDGLEIYFSSDRPEGQGDWDLCVVRRSSENEDWEPPENLGPGVNSPSMDSMPSVSSDGLTLCFCSDRPGGHGNMDIWASERETLNSPWQEPVNLGSQVNSSFADGDPWISEDSLELYFISRRPGGSGGQDIWVTKRSTQNEPWRNPENLGSGVNSPYNDMPPCLSPDGLLLLFSGVQGYPSRPGGFGGSDIWISTKQTTERNPEGYWSEAQNLGPQVNSAADEVIPRISPDSSMLYFSTLTDEIWDNWQAPIVPIVDFNGDGIVDSADLYIMVDRWHKDNSLCDIGPMPWGDGIVDVEDLKVLAGRLFEKIDDPTLIAHWAFDETEGAVAQDSAGNNDGDVVGDPVWLPSGGQVDGAVQLDGVDDVIVGDLVTNLASGPFSVLAWAKGGAAGQAVVSEQDGARWLSADPSQGYLTTELTSSGRGGGPLRSETVITDGDWHRIGLVWDGYHRTLTVDGAVVAEDAQTGLMASDQGLYIGAGSTLAPGTFFSGVIDDVRIYNRAESP